MRLKTTKAGRRLRKARTLADIELTVTVRSRAGQASRTTPVPLVP